MSDWINLILDVILIVVVSIGIYQAMRLIRQLADLRSSRTEMDRFVRDFNSAVIRAEAGIKALRSAARESGDDLEKLVDKAVRVRDELNFIVESADGVAERLSNKASSVLHADRAKAPEGSKPEVGTSSKTETPASSRAEQDLIQALKKLS
jgi:hypothetical protein